MIEVTTAPTLQFYGASNCYFMDTTTTPSLLNFNRTYGRLAVAYLTSADEEFAEQAARTVTDMINTCGIYKKNLPLLQTVPLSVMPVPMNYGDNISPFLALRSGICKITGDPVCVCQHCDVMGFHSAFVDTGSLHREAALIVSDAFKLHGKDQAVKWLELFGATRVNISDDVITLIGTSERDASCLLDTHNIDGTRLFNKSFPARLRPFEFVRSKHEHSVGSYKVNTQDLIAAQRRRSVVVNIDDPDEVRSSRQNTTPVFTRNRSPEVIIINARRDTGEI